MSAQLQIGYCSGAYISPCERYRYSLTRDWGQTTYACNRVAFIGLNPSTADAAEDDPTIRRCIRYAQDWGYSGLLMVNLYAYRATDPRDLAEAPDPVGNPHNDRAIQNLAPTCDLFIAAWGATDAPWRNERAAAVCRLLDGYFLHSLGVTREGHPRHPLYLRADAKPELWPPAHREQQG
jgi:hypothetical protein